MRFQNTDLQGVFLIEPETAVDGRGSFARAFDERVFAENGCPLHIVQSNVNQNTSAGTLRGMHYQIAPHAETKLVRVVVGAIHDVVVDLRPDSPSFRKWEAFELSAENGRALYIPAGCAHGLQTLKDNTEVFYEMGNYYHPESARGVRFDDPTFNITWPMPVSVISERDKSHPDFA